MEMNIKRVMHNGISHQCHHKMAKGGIIMVAFRGLRRFGYGFEFGNKGVLF